MYYILNYVYSPYSCASVMFVDSDFNTIVTDFNTMGPYSSAVGLNKALMLVATESHLRETKRGVMWVLLEWLRKQGILLQFESSERV